jgi:hypothetical protein
MIMQNHVRCRTRFLRKHILFLSAWLISGFINTFLFCIRSIFMAHFFNLGQVSVGFNRQSVGLAKHYNFYVERFQSLNVDSCLCL